MKNLMALSLLGLLASTPVAALAQTSNPSMDGTPQQSSSSMQTDDSTMPKQHKMHMHHKRMHKQMMKDEVNTPEGSSSTTTETKSTTDTNPQ